MNNRWCKAGKKAEMGVGTLIVFIAFILVAAIAAGVLIQTAISLQQRALSVGDQAESNIATHVDIIEISATDGRDGFLNNFTQIIRLSSGSDPIKLSDSFLSINSPKHTANLKYRGTSGVTMLGITGYNTYNPEQVGNITNNTWVLLQEDYDDDGSTDSLKLYTITDVNNNSNTSWVTMNLSTAGLINVTLKGASGLPVSLGNASAVPVTIDMTDQAFAVGSTTYGYLTIIGTQSTNDTIDASLNVTVTPYERGDGFFSVEYLNKGSNYVNGYLQAGDTIKLYYETPEDVGESVQLRINFIPKVGTSTLVEFTTPDVLSQERVYLYP